MKKFNKNSLVFFFAIIFLVCGFFGNYIKPIYLTVIEAAVELKHGNIDEALDQRHNIDRITADNLPYHNMLVDIHSAKENLLGTRLIQKKDENIVKSYNNSLKSPDTERIDDSEMNRILTEIKKLETVTTLNGARFLYCGVPTKEYYNASDPANIKANQKDNYLQLLEGLRDRDIPYIDMADAFDANGISEDDIFFKTDHHWQPKSGVLANKTICEALNSKYQFSYNPEYTSIDNYQIESFSDLFLGSYGKKVGTYFSWDGADDFDLITPKFETQLIEEQPFKNEMREGNFEDTVLFMENMKKDYYSVDTYSTYGGGNFRLEVIKNKLNADGAKILMIRDSYGQAVSPFLSLQTSELHTCDVRRDGNYVGEKINVQEYIEQIKPDYVIVLYSGISALRDDTFF